MARFSVLVETHLRDGVADPEGATIERSLPALGFDGVSGVRVGKAFRFTVDSGDEVAARAEVEDMCKRFLTNPVIEDATISVQPSSDVGEPIAGVDGRDDGSDDGPGAQPEGGA